MDFGLNNWLRTKVSGQRQRYTEGNWNVDLSYICTNRIIVMSYPATGTKTLYRNDINTVSEDSDSIS